MGKGGANRPEAQKRGQNTQQRDSKTGTARAQRVKDRKGERMGGREEKREKRKEMGRRGEDSEREEGREKQHGGTWRRQSWWKQTDRGSGKMEGPRETETQTQMGQEKITESLQGKAQPR